jgi:hypothetical protein
LESSTFVLAYCINRALAVCFAFIIVCEMGADICTVQYSTVRYGTVRCGAVRCGAVRYGTVRYGTVRYRTVRYGTLRYVTVRYGTVRYSAVQCSRMEIKSDRVIKKPNSNKQSLWKHKI